MKNFRNINMYLLRNIWGHDHENFEIARKQWKGILLVERFKKLKKFGYLEVPNAIL